MTDMHSYNDIIIYQRQDSVLSVVHYRTSARPQLSPQHRSVPIPQYLSFHVPIWTVLASDLKTLEAFHMKCQRQILQVKWQQFVRNREMTAITGLPSMSDIISRRRNAVFGHIARLDDDVPVHQALHAYVNLSLGRTPDPRWKRRPGRPRCRWIGQIRKDNNDTPPADVWKRAVRRGHGASLRPKLASR